MRPDNETKIIIIVNDQREMSVLHSRLIELSDELRLSRKVIKSVYGHYEVCFDNTIRIFILLKDYKYTDGWHCDYFAISTFDIDYAEKWQKQLSSYGKELTTFYAIKEKIKELTSKEDLANMNDIIKQYMDADIQAVRAAATRYQVYYGQCFKPLKTLVPAIRKVIFNDPATIVFWTDGTKTVVKAQGDDIFDPEKGLAMAISKKALGNKGNYCNELKKWLPEEKVLKDPTRIAIYNTGGTTNEWSENVKKSLGIDELSYNEILNITNLNWKPEND